MPDFITELEKQKPATLSVDGKGKLVLDAENNVKKVKMTRNEAKTYVGTLLTSFMEMPDDTLTHVRLVKSPTKVVFRVEEPDGPNYIEYVIKYTD